MVISKSAGLPRSPRRIDAIHLADDTPGGEPVDDGQVVRHSGRLQLRKSGELLIGLRLETAAQDHLACLQHPVKWTGTPARGGPSSIIGLGSRSHGAGRASVFELGRLFRLLTPTEHPAFVHRMKRIDEDQNPAQRQPCRNTALAEFIDDVGFCRPGKSGARKPGRESVKSILVHTNTIQVACHRCAR